MRYTSDAYASRSWRSRSSLASASREQTSIGFAMVKEARDLNTELAVLLKLRDTDPVVLDRRTLQGRPATRSPSSVTTCRRSRARSRPRSRRLDDRVTNLESFFNQMIELERDYGIQGFRYFGGGQ